MNSIAAQQSNYSQWPNSNVEAGYQLGCVDGGRSRGGTATSVRLVGRRQDLPWCRGRDALTAGGGEGGSYPWCRGSLLVAWATSGIPWCGGQDVDDGQRRKGWSWSLEVVAAQPGDLICLNRTPKRRHFDARSIKTTSF